MDDHRDVDDGVLPLRDRIPEYLVVFGVGLVASATVGLIVGVVRGGSLWTAAGYAVALLGIVMMLAGGATGGGYTHLGAGAIGAAFGGRHFDGDDEEGRDGDGRIDPMERLRRGLRPEANPRAFWQVIGGMLYVAVGIGVVILAS